MSTDSNVTKTIWQYSKPLPEEIMEFLREIAQPYAERSKSKLYSRMKRFSIFVREFALTICGNIHHFGFAGAEKSARIMHILIKRKVLLSLQKTQTKKK